MMRWIYGLALLAVLVWGLEQALVAPLETGDIYPAYSTLRTDPLGAKALYDSFAALPELTVERLYKERTTLEPDETMFVLGVDPVSFSEADDKVLAGLEKLAAKGGRLVIAFLQVQPRVSLPEKRAIEQRWHVALRYRPGPDENSAAIPRLTALFFTASTDWQQIGARDAVERRFGPGTIVLAADSFPLSNQGLREARDAAYLAALAGASKRIVFDENHFGVAETGSVTTLIRKYRLAPAAGVLALACVLFLWRSASSFLPPRQVPETETVPGRDAIDAMTALLYRGVPEMDLLDACFVEWSKSAPRDSHAAALEEAIRRERDPVRGYQAACRALPNAFPSALGRRRGFSK